MMGEPDDDDDDDDDEDEVDRDNADTPPALGGLYMTLCSPKRALGTQPSPCATGGPGPRRDTSV